MQAFGERLPETSLTYTTQDRNQKQHRGNKYKRENEQGKTEKSNEGAQGEKRENRQSKRMSGSESRAVNRGGVIGSGGRSLKYSIHGMSYNCPVLRCTGTCASSSLAGI